MANKISNDRPLFVSSFVDDYGFNLAEFRVLCAIARRGQCFERIALLAKRCRLERKTAWAALKRLEQCGAITRQRRRGQTSVFCLQPMNAWLPTHPKRQPSPPKGTSPRPKSGGGTWPEQRPTEGYPLKLFPIRKPRDYSEGI